MYVFDLDGTLIDSSARHWMLMVELLHQYGFDTGEEFADEFMRYKRRGNSGYRYLTDVLKISQQCAEEISSEWVKHIEDEKWLIFDTLYDDTIPTLKKIEGRILFLTIRNNKESLMSELKARGIAIYPIKVLSTGQDKAEILKMISDEKIMVGDTEIDYRAAVESDCPYYMLNRGFRSKEYWDKQGVASFDGLRYLLKD